MEPNSEPETISQANHHFEDFWNVSKNTATKDYHDIINLLISNREMKKCYMVEFNRPDGANII